jgi:predicted HicB family RNase H-like nuclease
MKTKTGRRGRPPKGSQAKSESALVRMEPREKEAFRAAAELAGLDLSTWIRERLRTVARAELEGAGQVVPFLQRPSAG